MNKYMKHTRRIENKMSRQKSKAQQRKSLKIKKRILLAVESVVALCVAVCAVIALVPSVRSSAIEAMASTSIGKNLVSLFGKETFDKTVYDISFDENKIQMNDLEYNYSNEYTNFVMFGIDSRTSQFDYGTNSDSILIVSIHNTTGEVRMVSIYRDTFLRIYEEDGSHYYGKINSAYAVGGAEGAINTINKNMDLQITDYVTVNFSGVAKIIDALGGIEVNLTEDEVYQLNKHLKSTISTTGEYAPGIAAAGQNIHLNGIQATTYCRIRKATFYDPETGDAISNDFGRSARQRHVIMKLVEKAKSAGIAEITEIMNTILNANTEEQKIIKTSFTLDEMVEMLPIIFKFSLEGSQGFPRKLSTGMINNVSYVMAKGVERNVKILHKFLYNQEDYEPTSTIGEIDADVQYQTGIGEDSSDDTVDDTVIKANNQTSEPETGAEDISAFDYDDGGKSDFY